MNAEPNADEIVMDLKKMLPPQVDYAELVASPVPSSYGICYVWEDPEPYQISAAIDLIESLQAQLAEYDEIAAEYGIDGKTMLTLAKSQIRTAQDNIKLQEQLTTSQRREKAAVEDIYKMTDGGECDVCKHYNPDKNTCAKPFAHYDECFEWRGPQEAGEGE
jgi:hypothetical protein